MTDPNTIMAAAACYRCIPDGMFGQVADYLAVQWASGGSTPLPPGCFYLTDDQGNYILDDQGNKIIVCL